ncbi:MAG TPA: manganese transporter, partial [Idiomarina abyssalis]|nr:manganese transporter [Idiomarina abyssalis]
MLKLSQFGPGALVAAAFIGPGTVVTASLAGANFGYALLWALLFSIVACVILQE